MIEQRERNNLRKEIDTQQQKRTLRKQKMRARMVMYQQEAAENKSNYEDKLVSLSDEEAEERLGSNE